jgi:hypothetical protein
MNDSASSEKRPTASPLLTPTDTSTLKQLWSRETTAEFRFNEYRLNRQPESLKGFTDQFLKEDGFVDHNRLIWTSKNSFVRVGEDWRRHELPGCGVYQDHRFQLWLTSGSHCLPINIHSTTLEGAMSCLELLVGLHDDHFEKMVLSHRHEEDEPPICLLTSVLLEKILQQSAKRKNSFRSTTFTPDQSRTLATSGIGTVIELNQCKFEDDGEAFLEALVARADPQTGLAKLTIVLFHPFAMGILVLLLHKLEALTLKYIHLESEEACRAVAGDELQYLELDSCELGDGGAALVKSVNEGRGPKGLGLVFDMSDDEDDWRPFDSSERFISFLNALRGNYHLERLVVSNLDCQEERILDALAAALSENEGLVHLALSGRHLDKTCFCKLMRAISAHSSLRTLDLTGIERYMDRTEATEEVTKMLSVNTQLEEIRIVKDDNDSVAWLKLVTPRLEYNIYCKRFPPIQNLRVPSTRAAIMARALSHVSNRPSPAFMLLRQNSDILSSYSLRVDPQIATSSGKRSRSPSSDAMGVSNLGAG